MIYPATYDITVLQNATWTETFRATNAAKPVTVDVATSVFTSNCHKLLAGDKVYIAPTASGSFLPCSLSTDIVHFVIASGLTANTFRIATTSSGSSLVLTGTASGTFSVSKPVDLTGYQIDADVKRLSDDLEVTTFFYTIIDASNGLFQLSLPPSTTTSLGVGQYGYDVSLTSGGGERYYWVTGLVTVQRTYSRN
jgi:hypothetical protein